MPPVVASTYGRFQDSFSLVAKSHPVTIKKVLKLNCFQNLIFVHPPAPQMILIIRCLYCLHPKMHPEIKNDSLIIILYIKSYLPFLNKLTIVMICDILF